MKSEFKMLEIGILLTENDAEYDSYNFVYGGGYGYFNENNIIYKAEDVNTAIEFARKYVSEGVNMTYAILTNQGIFDYEDEEFDDGNLELIGGGSFNAEDVEFVVAKIDGVIEEFTSIEKAREKWTEQIKKRKE